MRTWIALLMLGSTLMSCGGMPCAQRAGTYAWTLTARSGDCGEFRETIFTASGQQSMPMAPCSGTIHSSPDSCEVTHDQSCPVGMSQVAVRGVVHWDVTGSNGNGVLQYRITSTDASQECQGTYDAVYTRLNTAPYAVDAGS